MGMARQGSQPASQPASRCPWQTVFCALIGVRSVVLVVVCRTGRMDERDPNRLQARRFSFVLTLVLSPLGFRSLVSIHRACPPHTHTHTHTHRFQDYRRDLIDRLRQGGTPTEEIEAYFPRTAPERYEALQRDTATLESLAAQVAALRADVDALQQQHPPNLQQQAQAQPQPRLADAQRPTNPGLGTVIQRFP